MNLLSEIPDRFWSLFRSVNREVYIEALLKINEEYEYSSYFLSREVCAQILDDHFSRQKVMLKKEEDEEEDGTDPLAARILNWLLQAGWLRKQEDYVGLTAYIVIPDYASVFLEAFDRLIRDEADETEVYIQNVYAILFSYKNDPRANAGLLKTALINTRKLNKALQDMLHNMDKFFASLLEKQFYGDLLREHLEGYVEEVIKKKYHILKTSDNFYLYKTDIKRWISELREDFARMEEISLISAGKASESDILRMLDDMERGFDDIERRIANMDREHTKYVTATVSRLNYLLNHDDDAKGLVIQLLNGLSGREDLTEPLAKISKQMNLASMGLLSAKSLYKKRKPKTDFSENLEDEEESPELDREDILRLNRVGNRFTKKEIEEFVTGRMEQGRMQVTKDTVQSDQELEKLILAYDYAIRRNSLFTVEEGNGAIIDNGRYRYPELAFTERKRKAVQTDIEKNQENTEEL